MSKTSSNDGTEASSLARVRVRLITEDELPAWNAWVDEKHYLCSRLVGPTLRYVAEVDGEWVGWLSFGQASYHLGERDMYIGWNDIQRGLRLGLLAQNRRFVLLHERGRFPHLASRILSVMNKRVSADWQNRFGTPGGGGGNLRGP